MNRHAEHVYLLAEDDADRQIAKGFEMHYALDSRRLQVGTEERGWGNVLRKFQVELVPYLQKYPLACVILLIDYDNDYTARRAEFDSVTPAALKERVFVLGAESTPENLRNAVGLNFREIGHTLATECAAGTAHLWCHAQLVHNDPDRLRLISKVHPILFPPASPDI